MNDGAVPDPASRIPHRALVLTATDRLARSLREDANLALARSGAAVWEAPRIASLSRWLIDTWTASWPDAQLLSATQELVLWREAVERDEAGAHLLAPISAAREARRADQLLRRHRIDPDAGPAWQDEHQAFARWRRTVQRRMAQQHWLTAADLPAQVTALIEAGRIEVPPELELAGFLSPPSASERAVLDALAARGTHIVERPRPQQPVRVTHHLLADDEAQWRFAVADIRERLAALGAGLPPRIVIALPDPEAARALGESVLRHLLAPWSVNGEGALPWRWDRGRRLSEQPLVDTLLALLQLRAEANAPEQVSRVLLSAGLWSEAERALTARADRLLREAGWPRIRLGRVIEVLPEALRPRFEALARTIAALPTRALPSEWAARFRAQAEALGWPGREALDSASHQAVQAALGLFDRLGTLDAQLGRVPLASAREWFAELARATVFAARVEHAQPVLITSIEEAAALSCDVLYVLDATAGAVPPPARPTPLVAPDLLRAAGVPEASPEAWLARAQGQAAQLLGVCAARVLVCMPAVDARGAQQQPSSLFGEAGAWPRAQAPRAVGALESSLHETTAALDWMPQDPVPAVDADEQAGLRCGSELFRAWFESPFFAFCRHRLGIAPLPQPPRGIDARVQGTLVHKALEDLWGALRHSAALAAIDDDALSARIFASLDARLPGLLPAADFGAVTRALERARAHDVLLQWLRHERTRLDAFSVEQREVPAQPQVAGLRLSLRLDRVDRVQTPLGERWLVIDYKTGAEARQAGWNAERLKEPQLPLYASHAALEAAGIARVDGVCFGHLKDGHPALVAMTNWRAKLRHEPVADAGADWDAQLQAWRTAIESAARAFLAGEAWMRADVTARSHYADLLALTGGLPNDEAPEESA